jgi:hypothetical protein
MQDAAGTPNAFSDGHRSIQEGARNEPAASQPSTVLAQPSSRARFGEIFEYSRAMAAAAKYRSNPIFEAAWQEGTRMTLAEAIGAVLEP